jgi:hypothetical protein
MSAEPLFRVLSLDETDAVPILDGALHRIPVRMPLGVRACGCNAFSADAGAEILGPLRGRPDFRRSSADSAAVATPASTNATNAGQPPVWR